MTRWKSCVNFLLGLFLLIENLISPSVLGDLILPPSPYSADFKSCGISRKGYLCDPSHLIPQPASNSLQEFLLNSPRDTPCLCRHPCFRNEASYSSRLIVAALVLDKLPDVNTSISQFAESVRNSWHLGVCDGNDVLILVAGRRIHITYGSIVARALSHECIKRLIARYNPSKDVVQNILQSVSTLREFFIDPCMCRPCKNTYSWFKIPAMLLACFCLLTWLSLVGRRAYLRRNHLLPSRPYCSISDLSYLGPQRPYRLRISTRPNRYRTGLHPVAPNHIWDLTTTNSNQDFVPSSEDGCDGQIAWPESSPQYRRGTASPHFSSYLAPPPYYSLKDSGQLPPSYSEAQSTTGPPKSYDRPPEVTSPTSTDSSPSAPPSYSEVISSVSCIPHPDVNSSASQQQQQQQQHSHPQSNNSVETSNPNCTPPRSDTRT